ncbi:MAG: hypothetical protein QM770_20295 [Tepidisphaeraceae bacterium]
MLKGDKQRPWPDVFDRVHSAEQIALPASNSGLNWRDQREQDDARLRSAGYDDAFCGFDLYHHHTLFVKGLWQLDLVPKGAKVVLSIWGSDLLRVAGEYEYGRQLAALKRADVITVQSLELRETLLAKFGRELKPKVHLATFGTARLPLLAKRSSDDALRAFRRTFEIPEAEFTVVVGHAATPFDHHVPILEALATLPEEWKRRLALVLPMAYGGNESYATSVRDALASMGIRGVQLRSMLSDDQIVLLRHASDVFVYLPESDALSGSVQEALFAGNAVISGSWLPYYSRLRRGGVPIADVEAFDELPAVLVHVLSSLDEWRVGEAGRKVIRSLCDWSQCVDAWVDAYRMALA